MPDYWGLPASDDPGVVWRIGFQPDPWKWPDWRYAEDDGRFGGRWDDPDAQYRTLYVGTSPMACFVEVLAKFRRHAEVADAVDAIESDNMDEMWWPTSPAGTMSRDWVNGRCIGSADLTGKYAQVTKSLAVAILWPNFRAAALEAGAKDFDTSTMKDSAPRHLTQRISRDLYEFTANGQPVFEGIEFASRHGDDLLLWAVFEHPGDGETSPQFHDTLSNPVGLDNSNLNHVMYWFDLVWEHGD